MGGAPEEERDNIWILVPLAALMIPIVAIVGAETLQAMIPWIGGVLLIGAGAWAARSVLNHRHGLRMKEIDAQAAVLQAERDQLSVAERILELDEERAARKRELSEDT